MYGSSRADARTTAGMAQGFAWTFSAACLALVLIAAAHYYSIYRSERILQETAERVNLELVRQVVLADVNIVVTDLFVLARHIEQMPLQNAGEADPHLERVFVIFAEQKRLYDQIRFIDPQGRETLRVNFANGRASIEYVNPKFTEVTGYSLEEVLGRNPRILKSGDKAAEEYRTLWRTIAGGGEWRGEFHNRRKNGELYWESASISALRDDSGQVTHFLAVKEDITERKRLEHEVERRNRELIHAQALAEVGRMATMIAHDLRNPLSSVKIALQVLSKGSTPTGEADELRAIAREQVAYMEAILSDMLTFARPRAPALDWLSAERLLQPVVTLAERRLAGQGVELDTRYRDGLPTFPGDPHQLRQVFSNLISNAAQATEGLPPGERVILIRTDMEMAGGGTRIRIDVCDNGTGVAEADVSRLFEPFYTTRSKGTGLGLAIVRKILDQHGGIVNLGANRGGGTCASVLLPTVPSGAGASDAPGTEAARRREAAPLSS